VRDFRGSELTEVASFRDAELLARKTSKENTSGLMEVLVDEADGTRFVTGTFLRGKKRYQGKRARESSQTNNPPKV
jgi:hypothetical protein